MKIINMYAHFHTYICHCGFKIVIN